MRKGVEYLISNCIECILVNKKRGKSEGLLNLIPKDDVPFSTYHVDFLGPLPSTNKKYNHILTVVDAFTKFTWIYPVKSTSSQNAIEKLKQQEIAFGNPNRIVTDKGSAFASKEFQEYCDTEKIQHLSITTGIPRGNGQVEKNHGTIIPVLAKLSIDDTTKWFKFVPAVQKTLNSTVSRSTQRTPFELLAGVKLRTKQDLQILELLEQENINSFITDRENIRDDAKKNILKIQEENRRTYNKNRKTAHQYKKGDLVAIRRTQFGTGLKLRPKFFGPYEVLQVKPKAYDVKKVFLQIPSPLWPAGSVRTACSMSHYATPSTSPADGSSVPTRNISEANGRRETLAARVCELRS
ncbi:uncharacterized protein K02A2.6-like [Argiope bruennichi]|uniref:uncharacterized protein K02A2.6-like n=1 Tax=Argiope bruennichi TaxID=94029 RepID=UPI0024943008|nr:uncharacterized protein K02A2.6-like [Argiope bruennichi]